MSLTHFSFGIPSIDHLIDSKTRGFSLNDDSFVSCVVGPDGVGKSIIGLHAASTYASQQHNGPKPKVVYASTDLSWPQAKKSWEAFSLGRPKLREIKLNENFGTDPLDLENECNLVWTSPHDDPGHPRNNLGLQPFHKIFVDDGALTPEVFFLDLAKFSAGDDWGLLNRMLGLLATEEPANVQPAPHLLVIDAIEGLEAMVGELDGFGLRRSRRSRLAQLVRVARKVNCNLMFIIEQREDSVHLDEVFIADLVIRLRTVTSYGYLQKTIEIEKARGVSHVRGQHEFQIRSGNANDASGDSPDEPEILTHDNLPMPYCQVLTSLDVRPPVASQQSNRTELPESWFGIGPVDKWFRKHSTSNVAEFGSLNRVCLVVGESNSLKSALANQFLAQGFLPSTPQAEEVPHESRALLLTTKGLSKENVVKEIEELLNGLRENSNREINTSVNAPVKITPSYFVVRNISPRFISSAGFIFRVRQCIASLKKGLSNHDPGKRGNIRVVVDDWTTLLDTHPALKDDPRLLQTLVGVFRETGVTACIVSTQPGRPTVANSTTRPHDPLELDVAKIHVWPVDFFGSRRVAIGSSFAALEFNEPSIYELKRSDSNKCLTVDTDFALFENVDHGTAKRIPLRLRLYGGYLESDGEIDTSRGYASTVTAMFSDLFSNSNSPEPVVSFAPINKYSELRSQVHSKRGTRLDHSLVFQADEFWAPQDGIGLAEISEFFENSPQSSLVIENKMPLYKDFGFLLADREAWEQWKDVMIPLRLLPKSYKKGDSAEQFYIVARPQGGSADPKPDANYSPASIDIELQPSDGKPETNLHVGDVWNALCLPDSRLDMPKQVNLVPTWDLYFQAARIVADNVRRPAFDLDLRTTETVCSLILETWLSRILEFTDLSKEEISERLSVWSLSDLVAGCGEYLIDAVRLVKYMMPQVDSQSFEINNRPPNLNSVSIRTWFGASKRCQLENKNLSPLRLPGRASVLGTWFLAVARGSRSILLASQAIKHLCTEKMDLLRAEEGVGLPIRKLSGGKFISTPVLTRCREGRNNRRVTLAEISEFLEPQIDSPTIPWRRGRLESYGRDSGDFYRMLQELFRVLEVRPPSPTHKKDGRHFDHLIQQKDKVLSSIANLDQKPGNHQIVRNEKTPEQILIERLNSFYEDSFTSLFDMSHAQKQLTTNLLISFILRARENSQVR